MVERAAGGVERVGVVERAADGIERATAAELVGAVRAGTAARAGVAEREAFDCDSRGSGAIGAGK